MRKKSKGISPLVAVIMLIAFTMIVAGILAGWATRFATEQRSMLEKCISSEIFIKKAVYDDSTKNISLMLYNPGTAPLEGFQVQVTYDEDGPPLPDTWNIDDSVSANTFQTFVHSLDNTSVDFIEVRSIECRGAYDMVRVHDITGL